jgi:hypothetical protein
VRSCRPAGRAASLLTQATRDGRKPKGRPKGRAPQRNPRKSRRLGSAGRRMPAPDHGLWCCSTRGCWGCDGCPLPFAPEVWGWPRPNSPRPAEGRGFCLALPNTEGHSRQRSAPKKNRALFEGFERNYALWVVAIVGHFSKATNSRRKEIPQCFANSSPFENPLLQPRRPGAP